MPLLETRGITKRFSGLVAVSGVNLAVERAEVFGIIGPNGAGKTTLFNVISGQTAPTSGQVLLDGGDITGLPIEKVACRGLVRTFQRSLPFETLTLLDNLMAAAYATSAQRLRDIPGRWFGIGGEDPVLRARARENLALAGLSARADDLAGVLSHGDRRRLEIARALMCRPRILLLDEPAAGLSGHEAKELEDLLHSLRRQGQTVMIIEHNMGMVMSMCDRIVVLDRGVKIAEGTPADVQRNEAVIEAYIGRKATGVKAVA